MAQIKLPLLLSRLGNQRAFPNIFPETKCRAFSLIKGLVWKNVVLANEKLYVLGTSYPLFKEEIPENVKV